ncbi:hypothetical protein HF072_00600 [Bacillus sp. RO3]|nr:hypothetical protein [Bacillus sp. RO3]
MKGMLLNAAETKETLVMFYIDKKGNVTERFIKVLGIESGQIRAYCFFRKQKRTFSLENVLSLGRVQNRNQGA